MSLEHPRFNRVQVLEQQEEEFCRGIERLTPIFSQFQQKDGSVEKYAPKDVQEEEIEEEEKEAEEKEDEERQEYEGDQEDPKHTKEKPMEIVSSDETEEEIV